MIDGEHLFLTDSWSKRFIGSSTIRLEVKLSDTSRAKVGCNNRDCLKTTWSRIVQQQAVAGISLYSPYRCGEFLGSKSKKSGQTWLIIPSPLAVNISEVCTSESRFHHRSMGLMSILSICLGICNLPRRCARGMYCRESRTTRWISDRESLEADTGLQWSVRYLMISWRLYICLHFNNTRLQYSIPPDPRSKSGLFRGRNRNYDLTQYELWHFYGHGGMPFYIGCGACFCFLEFGLCSPGSS